MALAATGGTNTGDCADNLVCSASAPDNASPVCTTPVGVGGACNDGSVCPVDTHCDSTTHTCAKLPALGEACDPSVVFFCDPTASSGVCDSATSLCEAVVVVQPGAACSSSPTTCAGGICSYDADGGAGTCVGNLPDGSSCLPTDPCAFGSSCVGGTCQPVVCDGTPTDAGATAFVAAGPLSSGRQGSIGERSRRWHKLVW